MEPFNFRHLNVITNKSQYFFSTGLPNRPSYSNQGKEIDVAVNQFKVNSWPSKKVYQYDVSRSLSCQ
jgi:hypothetical protein